MNLQRLITKFKKALDTISLRAKVSYSQSGEDLIIEYLFASIGITQPKYIDIGANLPKKGNNTYLFYLKGSTGICIEPDFSLIKNLKNTRPNDTVLNIGVAIEKAALADFYYFDGQYNSWNTFSKEDAILKSKNAGIAFKEKKVALDTLHNICEKYNFSDVNFLSIDVEGLDLEILQSIDFNIIRPEVICVETIAFSISNTFSKNLEIGTFLISNGYVVYADTNLNTIFCRKDIFQKV